MAVYDLEERTLQFALRVRAFTKRLPRTIENTEYIKQLIRASASIGANYIEANESLGDKDKIMRMRISRKETKESRFYLRLVYTNDDKELDKERAFLVQESMELLNILS